MKSVIGLFSRTNLIVLLIYFAGFGTLAQAAVVTVDTARWVSNKDRLVLKGQSDTLNLVFLSDALTGKELATAQADDEGKWIARVKGLSPVPCHVRAVSGGSTAEKAVRRAPNDCSSAGHPPEVTANIFTKKYCFLCHGDDGSGVVDSGGDIQGKSASDVQRAIAEELVHDGIDVTPEEVNALVAFLDDPSPLPPLQMDDFTDPEQCKICHPRQFREWSGNMMAYSALSPTFSALEALGNAYSVSQGGSGFAAGDHSTALFCQSCHNPADTSLGNFPTLADSNGHALRDFATKAGRGGISCDICHQISGPDTSSTGLGRLGDGIANTAFVLEVGDTKFGPLDNPEPNPIHKSAHGQDINMQDGYLRSGEFCGTCHDVRTPPDARLTDPEDPVTEEPFQRLENLFTEWKNGPYGPINNTVGGVVTCQDCHMDLGPPSPAGSYAEGETTVYPRPRFVFEREEVSTHYFTGIDIALVDFPGQDDEARDENGNVIGQVQRRQILMESAAEIAVSAPPSANPGKTIPIMVHVTNSGTGHNLPSGFSQERQIWIELIVSDNNGQVVYESGTLVDTAHPETGEMAPDGNLDDEDLRNLVGPDGGSGVINPVTLEANVKHGPDYNRRHEDPHVYQGLANFGNEFIRIPVDANGEPMRDEQGHFIEEEVFMPFLSTHTDNGFSIPALETEDVRYDVEVPAVIEGPLQISARLRARAFPPRFLRALAAGRPDLVNEKMVDRNRIVEMVSATSVTVQIQ